MVTNMGMTNYIRRCDLSYLYTNLRWQNDPLNMEWTPGILQQSKTVETKKRPVSCGMLVPSLIYKPVMDMLQVNIVARWQWVMSWFQIEIVFMFSPGRCCAESDAVPSWSFILVVSTIFGRMISRPPIISIWKPWPIYRGGIFLSS